MALSHMLGFICLTTICLNTRVAAANIAIPYRSNVERGALTTISTLTSSPLNLVFKRTAPSLWLNSTDTAHSSTYSKPSINDLSRTLLVDDTAPTAIHSPIVESDSALIPTHMSFGASTSTPIMSAATTSEQSESISHKFSSAYSPTSFLYTKASLTTANHTSTSSQIHANSYFSATQTDTPVSVRESSRSIDTGVTGNATRGALLNLLSADRISANPKETTSHHPTMGAEISGLKSITPSTMNSSISVSSSAGDQSTSTSGPIPPPLSTIAQPLMSDWNQIRPTVFGTRSVHGHASQSNTAIGVFQSRLAYHNTNALSGSPLDQMKSSQGRHLSGTQITAKPTGFEQLRNTPAHRHSRPRVSDPPSRVVPSRLPKTTDGPTRVSGSLPNISDEIRALLPSGKPSRIGLLGNLRAPINFYTRGAFDDEEQPQPTNCSGTVQVVGGRKTVTFTSTIEIDEIVTMGDNRTILEPSFITPPPKCLETIYNHLIYKEGQPVLPASSTLLVTKKNPVLLAQGADNRGAGHLFDAVPTQTPSLPEAKGSPERFTVSQSISAQPSQAISSGDDNTGTHPSSSHLPEENSHDDQAPNNQENTNIQDQGQTYTNSGPAAQHSSSPQSNTQGDFEGASGPDTRPDGGDSGRKSNSDRQATGSEHGSPGNKQAGQHDPTSPSSLIEQNVPNNGAGDSSGGPRYFSSHSSQQQSPNHQSTNYRQTNNKKIPGEESGGQNPGGQSFSTVPGAPSNDQPLLHDQQSPTDNKATPGHSYHEIRPTLPNQEENNAQLESPPEKSIVIGNIPVELNTQNIVIGSHTFEHEESPTAAVINGQTFSWDSTRFVAPSATIALPVPDSKAPVVKAGGQDFVIHPTSIQAGEATIPRPQDHKPSPFVLDGRNFTLSPSQIIASDQHISLPPGNKPATFIYDGQTLSADSSNLFAGSTSYPISSSSIVAYNGQTLTFKPSEIIGPSTTIRYSPTPEVDFSNPPKGITTGGHVLSVRPCAAIIDSNTYSFLPGQAPETFEDHGQNITAGPNGVNFGSISIAIPSKTLSYSKITRASLTMSVAPSEAVIGGLHVNHIQPGMIPITTTISDQSIKIGPNGVVFSDTTIPYPTLHPSYSIRTLGHLTMSLAPSEAVIQDSTYHINSDSPITSRVIDRQTVIVGPSGIDVKGTVVDIPVATFASLAQVTADHISFSVGPTNAVIDGSTYPIGSGASERSIVVGSETIKAGTEGIVLPAKTLGMGVVLPATTISPGQTLTTVVAGDVSFAADATEAVINGTTYPIGSKAPGKTITASSMTIRLGSDGVILPFTTIKPWLNGGASGLSSVLSSVPSPGDSTGSPRPRPTALGGTKDSHTNSRSRVSIMYIVAVHMAVFVVDLILS